MIERKEHTHWEDKIARKFEQGKKTDAEGEVINEIEIMIKKAI